MSKVTIVTILGTIGMALLDYEMPYEGVYVDGLLVAQDYGSNARNALLGSNVIGVQYLEGDPDWFVDRTNNFTLPEHLSDVQLLDTSKVYVVKLKRAKKPYLEMIIRRTHDPALFGARWTARQSRAMRFYSREEAQIMVDRYVLTHPNLKVVRLRPRAPQDTQAPVSEAPVSEEDSIESNWGLLRKIRIRRPASNTP